MSFYNFRLSWVLLAVFCSITHAWELNNLTAPTSRFHSRPDMFPPIVKPDFLDPELMAPGYTFIAPYKNIEPGPYIYDRNGSLVWSGAADLGSTRAHAPHVCQYKGEDHLCFFRGYQFQGFARGHGVIMNKHYEIVKTVSAAGSAGPTDMHEFKLVDNGKHALVTSYQTRQFDMTAFGIATMGYIQDSIFQKIDVESGDLIFEWRSLDHETTSPLESFVGPDTTVTSGDGRTPGTAWDYFHINSIEPMGDDYMVSARHMSAIYKISGDDGRIMWALNGAYPSFDMDNGFTFSHQHDARLLRENGTNTVITLFDNAAAGPNVTHPESRGMIIDINHKTKIASLLRDFPAPKTEYLGISAKSQGNMQILPNGNILLGWGDHCQYSEYLPTGEPVAHHRMAQYESHVMSYRTQKFEWVGEPKTSPRLWAYSKYGNSKGSKARASTMAFHMSWNGATEVRRWALYGSNSAKGPWKQLAVVDKTGFETSAVVEEAYKWTYVHAWDENGKPLRKSNVAQTFVPSAALAAVACNDLACRTAPSEIDEQVLRAAKLFVNDQPLPAFDPYQNFENSALDRVWSFRQSEKTQQKQDGMNDAAPNTYESTEKSVDAPHPNLEPGDKSQDTLELASNGEWKHEWKHTWSQTASDKVKQFKALVPDQYQKYLRFRSIVMSLIVIAPFLVFVCFLRRGRTHTLRRLSSAGRSWIQRRNSQNEKPLLGYS